MESQFATYVMRMALARRLPEEAVFWLTCWYQDNVQQLETLDHWKTCLPQLREQFSPTPYDLREEWAKLRQTTTLVDFGQSGSGPWPRYLTTAMTTACTNSCLV